MVQNLQIAISKRFEEFEPIARSRTGNITFSLITSELTPKRFEPYLP